MSTSASLTDHTVAVYKTHEEADAAIKILADSGHDIKHLSIIGQDYTIEERPIGFINSEERMRSWGKYGAFWGSVWGLFLGSAMMFIPGLGYIMFAGYFVSILEGALVGGGVGVLAGALASLGIPKDSVAKYEWHVGEGRYLLVVHGDETEASDARKLLEETSTTSLETYSANKN